jgi:hypothetical protein
MKKGSNCETFEGGEPNLATPEATVAYSGIGHFWQIFRGTGLAWFQLELAPGRPERGPKRTTNLRSAL